MKSGDLASFRWKLGVHCSSTVIRNLFAFYGDDLSEDLCFGLGRGLGFVYFQFGDVDIPYISGRGSNLIENSFAALGYRARFESGGAREALERIDAMLSDGMPVALAADINGIPYIREALALEEFYPFSEHHLLCVGREGEGELTRYVIKDHLWPPMTVDVGTLLSWMSSDSLKPFGIRNHALEYEKPSGPTDPAFLSEACSRAIETNCHEMLHPYNPLNRYSGLLGMESFLAEYAKCSSSVDAPARRRLRFMYLPLEKIGTGGGNFRRMYARFLAEAAKLTGNGAFASASERYFALAASWKEFSALLHRQSAGEGTGEDGVSLLESIVVREREAIVSLYESAKERK